MASCRNALERVLLNQEDDIMSVGCAPYPRSNNLAGASDRHLGRPRRQTNSKKDTTALFDTSGALTLTLVELMAVVMARNVNG